MAPSIRRRRRPAMPPTPPAPTRNGLRASAQRFPLKNRKQVEKQAAPRRAWQDEAWEHFDDVPELKYSVWFEGNVMAKMKLYAAVIDPGDPDAPPIPASDTEAHLPAGAAARAQAELDRLKARLGGRAEIIRALNMNLEVAAEGYVVGFGPREVPVIDPDTEQPVTGLDGRPTGETELVPEEWGIFSVTQVDPPKGGRYTVKMRPGDKEGRKLDPNLDTIIRIFQRHPRWSLEADCNMRGVLSECEALVLLTNSIKATAKSQMGGGYLLIPNELSTGPDDETEPEDGEEAAVDPFLQELYDGAVDPVEDPSSAASVAPTFIRGPADALKEFRHVSIARPGDQNVLPKITAGIERIARGMNLPVEVVMGHQQTTFANALQVKQDTFDDHFQPRCVLICDALTVGFLQPNLIDAGMDPSIAERIVVWYDPSAMIKQVNPVDSADKGIEADLISGEAWRRAWGWSEDDAPDPVERLTRAVLRLTQLDPGISTAVLELLGVTLEVPETLPGTTAPAAAALPAAAAAWNIEESIGRAIRAQAETEEGRERINAFLAQIAAHDPTAARATNGHAPTPSATPPSPPALVAGRQRRNRGAELTALDRDLRMRLLTAADVTLTRVLERAGNKLRSKAGQTRTLAKAGRIHSIYVAATLGPKLVAAAGFSDAELIESNAWDSLEGSFRTWTAAAQKQALRIAGAVVTITPEQRDTLELRQADDLDRAWTWLKDELIALAAQRLYSPDPAAPPGESDPTVRVPVGLIRQALARAGGATGLTTVDPGKAGLRAARRAAKGGGSMANPGPEAEGAQVFVAVNNDIPAGGIGTGELVGEVLTEGGAGIEGFVWVYGPAFRAHPFDPHEELDGVPFVNFDDDVLSTGNASEDASWIGDFLFPGDHDGCNCDFEPTVLDPDEVAAAADSFSDLPLTTNDGEPVADVTGAG